jgi:gamma-glutamylcyclotransferase (GGCT)/AIG2-like uncharacterized protein YtfP
MRLFCYGTLQFADIMHEVSGRRFVGVPAMLEHYACFSLHGEVFPGIVPAHAAQTAGVMYSGLDERVLRRLDGFESDCYVRECVRIHDAAGRSLQAWAYVVRPDARTLLSNQPWDRGQFERMHLAAFLRRLAG